MANDEPSAIRQRPSVSLINGDTQKKSTGLSKMNILITGAHGQVGRELTDQGRSLGLHLWPTDVEDLDITNATAVTSFIEKRQISVVVNAAAYTAVDRAETDAAQAKRINRDGPATLARACTRTGSALIHISTDYVYDGLKTTPYVEDDPVAPTGVYGTSKAEGDQEVQRLVKQHVILRTAWLYSVHGQNFVKTILNLARERAYLNVVADQIGCPTSAVDLARAILDIIINIIEVQTVAWGIYHYCGAGQTTWYEFAKTILKLAGQYEDFALKTIRPISTDQYPTPAARPPYAVLDCTKIESAFGIRPVDWRTSLQQTIDRLYASQGSLSS
jgi:dTDP-4-dehydrorhamnose reductase